MAKLNDTLPKLGTSSFLVLCGMLVGWGMAWKTLDAKADTATSMAIENRGELKDHSARIETFTKSYGTFSSDINQLREKINENNTQLNSRITELKTDTLRELEEIKKMIRNKNLSWMPEKEIYIQ
ncbi:MAG: hypothetical protein IMZ53_10130 [Thermoplasmata archaeon]|nr:hypothetical protein [Thermoplasmata archaeon]